MFKTSEKKNPFKKPIKDYEYLPVKNLRFEVIDLNYVFDEKSAKEKYNNLTKCDFSNKIVRVSIKCGHEQLQNIDIEYIKKCTTSAYDVNEIVPIIINNKKARNEEIKPELNDKEAIEKFIEDSGRQDKKELMEIFNKEIINVIQGWKYQ